MFEQLTAAPPDPILGLTEAFKKDPRQDKINLGVGVYTTDAGATPVLESVKLAEEALLKEETTKNYLAIPGPAAYGAEVQKLLFGADHEIVSSGRAATAQTPGGTGGLRVAADFIRKLWPSATVWLSEPTWPNHPQIFQAAGLGVKSYPYYDYDAKALAFDAMLAALRGAAAGDVVVFHACCHNPSGMDPDAQQWAKLAEFARERKVLPMFDFAYQGFGDGIDEDAAGLRAFCAPGAELLVCSSFSKNFGLYNERVGALTVVAANNAAAEAAFSHVKSCIRSNYSNPPSHGGAIVTKILGTPPLRALWEKEVEEMRGRINGMRHALVEELRKQGVQRDFSFIARQKGMFSFSGLDKAQVERLRDEFGVYIVGSGRISIAGLNSRNIGPLCAAIARVI